MKLEFEISDDELLSAVKNEIVHDVIENMTGSRHYSMDRRTAKSVIHDCINKAFSENEAMQKYLVDKTVERAAEILAKKGLDKMLRMLSTEDGKSTGFIRCTNEQALARSEMKRNGVQMKFSNTKGCISHARKEDTEERRILEAQVRQELEEIRSMIPINSYRSILGQIRKGCLNEARRGIRNYWNRLEGRKHAESQV